MLIPAKNPGFTVKAEGIEMRKQVMLLHGLPGDMPQGYYFSRPVPVADLLLARDWTVAVTDVAILNAGEQE